MTAWTSKDYVLSFFVVFFVLFLIRGFFFKKYFFLKKPHCFKVCTMCRSNLFFRAAAPLVPPFYKFN